MKKKPKSCRECKYAILTKKMSFPEQLDYEKITCELMNKRCDMFVLEGHGIRPDCPVKWDEAKE